MVSDPPYGISLDSEWRDRAGLNGCGPAEASYMKNRTEGHTMRRDVVVVVNRKRRHNRSPLCRALRGHDIHHPGAPNRQDNSEKNRRWRRNGDDGRDEVKLLRNVKGRMLWQEA